jgi:hypothetical protein
MSEEFITRDEYNRFMTLKDYEAMNYLAGLITKRCVEQMFVMLPSVIHNLVGQAALMKGLSEKFYTDNKDLLDHKMEVAQAIEAIQSANPGMKMEELLRRAAPLVRERIVAVGNAKDYSPKRSLLDQEIGNL